jgi:hypothetical protein
MSNLREDQYAGRVRDFESSDLIGPVVSPVAGLPHTCRLPSSAILRDMKEYKNYVLRQQAYALSPYLWARIQHECLSYSIPAFTHGGIVIVPQEIAPYVSINRHAS